MALYDDLKKKQDKLHLLKALKVILLDIDKAIEAAYEKVKKETESK